MAKKFKPGEEVLQSGIVDILNKSGKPTGDERTVVKGEPHPPTPKPGQSFRMKRPTRH